MSYRDCPAMFGENLEKRCVGCGEQLTGRRRVWCGGDCERLWRANHVWGFAREFALWRDTSRPRGRRDHVGAICARCRFGGRYASLLEVNHRVPIMGRHAEVSCLHHQEGLEVLCHECHVDETNRQFGRGRYREAKPDATPQLQLLP